jgi:hypothetical protein
MNGVLSLVLLFSVFAIVLAIIAFVAYRRVLRRAKGIERGLKTVPLLIHLPPPGDKDDNQSMRDSREVMRERISQAEVLYDLIAGTAQTGFKSNFYGQRHIAFEIIASNGLIHFFAAVPIALVSPIEQAILTAYPGARIEEVEDHNIFNPQGRLTGTVGGELVLKNQAAYPIGTLDQMERDPMEGLLNALTKLKVGDGAGVQIMLRPANPKWSKASHRLVGSKRRMRGQAGISFNAADLAKAAYKAPEQQYKDGQTYELSKLEESVMQSVEEKTRHPAYEVLVRVIASSPSYDRSEMLLRTITNSFALFEAPGSNGFQFLPARDIQGLVTAFIFRFFPPEVTSSILNSVEMATLFHLPDSQYTASNQVERQQSKQVDGPVNASPSGLLFGYNLYRGVKKEIRLSVEDRRRHMYIVGQTGTGKSTMLENLAVQDMLSGNGFAFIDPHGDVAERLISMVPKERAEDVVYFNPADMDHPLGLNLFEYDSPQQKDFLIQESINMLYKMYDPGKTGIIGPRFEHWYRNAALTLMADPGGATFIELPKVFTDTAYLKQKFKYLDDPTVIDFWTKEMGQTSDYHKSEMLGWFVSKFGAFQSNEMMRNIIGQTHSAFNLRQIMDQKKILIVNLSKGQVGELNSQLLGMLFVIKIQAAAMSRASVDENARPDFSLYVDEFQNFSTDSFASILSEARKFRLNLIVANQFIGQLTDPIRDAVFGNIGTIMSYRTGPEDGEFLVKQFEPVFDVHDLVNLPNYNAVMKLLIGGLPSRPFSIAALPPLGQIHAEMGLAVKQLSAAKFGVTRSQVEADIFARMQGKPRPNLSAAQATPPPDSSQARLDAAPDPLSALNPQTASPTAPPPVPAPAPTVSSANPVSVSAPSPRLAPAPPPPVPANVATTELEPRPAPVAPVPAAPSLAPLPVASAPKIGPSITDVVGVPVTPPLTSRPAPVSPQPTPAPTPTSPVAPSPSTPLLSAPIPTVSTPLPPAPVAISSPPPPSPAQPSAPAKPLLIEAHEEDGKQESVQELAADAQHLVDETIANMPLPSPDSSSIEDDDQEHLDAPILRPAEPKLPPPVTAPMNAITKPVFTPQAAPVNPAHSTPIVNSNSAPIPIKPNPAPAPAAIKPSDSLPKVAPASFVEPVTKPVLNPKPSSTPQPTPAPQSISAPKPSAIELIVAPATIKASPAPKPITAAPPPAPKSSSQPAAAPKPAVVNPQTPKPKPEVSEPPAQKPSLYIKPDPVIKPLPEPEPLVDSGDAETPQLSGASAGKTMIMTHRSQPIVPPSSPSYEAIAAPKMVTQKPNIKLEPSPNPVVALPTPPKAVGETKAAIPKLKPGEVYIDDDGNVTQG